MRVRGGVLLGASMLYMVATGAVPATGAPGVAARAGSAGAAAVADATVQPALLQGLRFRSVGPYRGGRVTAVHGIPGRRFSYLFGSTGGGVWRTDNGGLTWRNISDGFFEVGPVGAIEVADADPNVIYVGTGSACIRGNISIGRGLYRSTDMGRTWSFIGLPEAGQIGRIVADPRDADRVYVAALGNPFGANGQRGVFRSLDGGATWDKVLYVSDQTGAVDLAINPTNPRVLYAAFWRGERKPWTVISGSEDGGLFRSTDGGDTWDQLAGGFPQGLVGKIGVAVSPANPQRVWAVVEAAEGRSGVYRSDDGGDSWDKTSDRGSLVGRPWYYMHVYADPVDENTVYVLNTGLYISVDGGRTFDSIPMPHTDQHDLWIDPANPGVLLVGNDGGATISVDGGASWSPQLNQPTGEFYSVTVDDAFPYRIYGPQQDNSTISVPSAATYSGISLQHWLAVGGCETGPIAIDSADPNVVYAGCFGGRLARFDRRTEQFRQIRDYPEEMAGMPERELRYRIQWNAPITASRHHPGVLYHGSQYVHRSADQGQSWQVISPDLTGNHAEMFGPAGGPITHDITGVEIYSALLAIEEDVYDPEVLWTGSNDGVVSISRDGGTTWSNVTPPGLPELSTVNRIEPSPHGAGKVYVTAYRYRVDDWAPYVFRTQDYGASWERIADGTRGIPAGWPVRVVREDPVREGLLYAGTEFGLFVSWNDGASWQSLQLNLPRTPVSDLRVHAGDLVVATQGRGFWVLDDLGPLRQMSPQAASARAWLFSPRVTYRTSATHSERDYDRDRVYGAMLPRGWLGENPPDGAILYYMLGQVGDATVQLEIRDPRGEIVRTFRSDSDEQAAALPTAPGLNRFVWDLSYPGSGGRGPFASRGPRAVPGSYRVALRVGEQETVRPLEIRQDPRLLEVTVADLQAQFDFLQRLQRDIEALQQGVDTIRSLRKQLAAVASRIGDAPGAEALHAEIEAIQQRMDTIEGELVQTNGAGWAHPAKLLRNLGWLATAASSQRGVRTDARPTDQLLQRADDVEAMLHEQLDSLRELVQERLVGLNRALLGAGVPAIGLEPISPRAPEPGERTPR